MDQQTPTTTSSAPTADATLLTTTTTTNEPPLSEPQEQQQQQPEPACTHPPQAQPIPTLNPNPQPQPSRPHQAFSRPLWNHPHFQHFSSSPSPSLPVSTSTVSPSVSASQPRAAGGGIAIGMPAPTQASPSSFSSSFRHQQLVGLGRGLPEPTFSTATSQATPGVQGIGMVGSMNSGSQLRPAQSSTRPPPLSRVPQDLQGQSFMRSSSGGPSPAQPSSSQPPNQPWMSSGKPPLPSPSYRAQMTSPSLPPRSITAQLQQQQQSLSSSSAHQPADHREQQVPPSKFPQPMARGQVLGSQKAASPAMVQPNAVESVAQSKVLNAVSEESSGRILSKRTIHELVSQIDSSERLDPEVEGILADIADEFVDSITTFGCYLAMHRKSDRLEAKDILLHVEKNWNITLPGFSGDETKMYRKPIVNDIHKERLAAIKKSVLASDMANAKNPVGQVVGNAKSNQSKTPASAVLSPNLKVRKVS